MTIRKRPLGQTGMEVSCLGLGTVKFGRNHEVKYPTSFALPEDRQVASLLDQARDLGINLLDTAPAYGSAEQRLGRLLRQRDEWIISTKVGEEFTNGKSFFDFSAAHTRRSVERSLRNINTDYLDIVLIHSDGRDEQILDATDCLQTLRAMQQEGLIRAIGMSTKTPAGGLRAVQETDVVMATYNKLMLDDSIVIDSAREHNKGILIKKALNSGHACTNGGDSAAASLQFALQKSGVSTVIIGTINAAHLAANAAAVASVQ
jgi:aryl-alcohol dehydrogenase-like predicted oxidoreductase